MKLLMVTREQIGEERFGIGRSLAALCNGLRDNGCVVECLTRASLQAEKNALLQSETDAATQRLSYLGLKRQPDLLALITGVVGVGRTAARLALQQGIDLLHVHDVALACGIAQIVEEFGAEAASLRWGLTKHSFGCIASALHQHVMPVQSFLQQRIREWERQQLALTRWVCIPTHAGLKQLADDLGIEPSAHWKVLPHPRPKINRYDRIIARRLLGWSLDEYRVLGVGMYLPVKRFDRLIQVCAGFGPELKLTLVGDGNADSLRWHAKQSGLGNRLELATTDDIGLYLSGADLYVSTSYSESFGLANLEAMIAGLPSIVSPVAAVPEVIGNAALQVNPDGPTLEKAIKRVRDEASLRNHLRLKACARAKAWPDAKDIAKRLMQMINDGDPNPPVRKKRCDH